MPSSVQGLVFRVAVVQHISRPNNILPSFDCGRDGLLECPSMLANQELENMRNANVIGIDLPSALVVFKTVSLDDRFVFTLGWRQWLLQTDFAKGIADLDLDSSATREVLPSECSNSIEGTSDVKMVCMQSSCFSTRR